MVYVNKRTRPCVGVGYCLCKQENSSMCKSGILFM